MEMKSGRIGLTLDVGETLVFTRDGVELARATFVRKSGRRTRLVVTADPEVKVSRTREYHTEAG